MLQEKLGAEFLLLETGEGEGRLKANGPDRCDPEKKEKGSSSCLVIKVGPAVIIFVFLLFSGRRR